MGAMDQRLQRMRLSCGLSQRNWLVSQAIQRSGFMVTTELIDNVLRTPFYMIEFFRMNKLFVSKRQYLNNTTSHQ